MNSRWCQAHPILPQAFAPFFKLADVQIHDPKHLVWWNSTPGQQLQQRMGELDQEQPECNRFSDPAIGRRHEGTISQLLPVLT